MEDPGIRLAKEAGANEEFMSTLCFGTGVRCPLSRSPETAQSISPVILYCMLD